MKKLIITELNKFSSGDFHVGCNIPRDKLNNAIKHYPIESNEEVLALIDSTVFGSAKNGMAIGLAGVYWKNDWATETSKNFLSWEELIPNIGSISTKGFNLTLARGCVFSLAGCSVKSGHLAQLLISIIKAISANTSNEPITVKEGSAPPEPIIVKEVSAPSEPIIVKEVSAPSEPKKTTVQHEEKVKEFHGSYDQGLLDLVNAIAQRHRLPKSAYIAPSIKVHRVKTILEICKENIDPYSIIFIVDNTFLGNCKDFLMVTPDAVYAKAFMEDVDKFEIDNIRSIHCDDCNFFINKHKFQFFDQLEKHEVEIVVEFLHELVGIMQEIHADIAEY